MTIFTTNAHTGCGGVCVCVCGTALPLFALSRALFMLSAFSLGLIIDKVILVLARLAMIVLVQVTAVAACLPCRGSATRRRVRQQ